MQKNSIGGDPEKKKPELEAKPMSRKERRFLERKNQEYQEAFNRMADKFLNYFTNHENPEGEEVVERAKQFDAQWRTFAKAHNLKPVAFTLMKDYIDGLTKEYFKNKEQVSVLE